MDISQEKLTNLGQNPLVQGCFDWRLLEEPIGLARQLPCNGGEDCLHCKLLRSLNEPQELASRLYSILDSVLRQMAVV